MAFSMRSRSVFPVRMVASMLDSCSLVLSKVVLTIRRCSHAVSPSERAACAFGRRRIAATGGLA